MGRPWWSISVRIVYTAGRNHGAYPRCEKVWYVQKQKKTKISSCQLMKRTTVTLSGRREEGKHLDLVLESNRKKGIQRIEKKEGERERGDNERNRSGTH